MDYYKGTIPILDVDHPRGAVKDMLFMPKLAQEGKIAFGCVPRDYGQYPKEMFDPPSQISLIPESELDARYDEQEAQRSSLEHLYLSGPNGDPAFINLDQDGDGHCWAYDLGHALMFQRMVQGQPLVRMNPHSIATCLRQFNGGWCGLSAKFAREVGCAPEGTGPGQWPLHSNDTKLDTPEMRKVMNRYRITEDFVDLTRDVYDQNLTEQQIRTCNFLNLPTPTDYNWWSHSVLRIRTVRIEAGSWGALIINSWKGWGRHGLAVLKGSQATANGALAVRQVLAA